MATRQNPDRLPPRIAPFRLSLSDKLLAARHPLPPNPCLHYLLLQPKDSQLSSPHDILEDARRLVISHNRCASLLDSVLLSVQIGRNALLYVFAISSTGCKSKAVSLLETLNFYNFDILESSSFSLERMHQVDAGPSTTCQAAEIHNQFLAAVRLHLISEIVHVSTTISLPRSPNTRIQRFKDGFLMRKILPGPNSCWNGVHIPRPLTLVRLNVQISCAHNGKSYLDVQPFIFPTPFSELSTNLSLSPGSPITLLPYGTPAYFLTVYSGPTTGLIKQFQDSLQGLGTGAFFCEEITTGAEAYDDFRKPDGLGKSQPFIIGWINVENKRGEAKGLPIVYPSHLCLCLPPSLSRPPLGYLPELPELLQPSPPASMDQIGAGTLNSRKFSDFPIQNNIQRLEKSLYFPTLSASPSFDCATRFRSLILSRPSDIQKVAVEIGEYVDAVAKERERERERLKREREFGIGSSPKLIRSNVTVAQACPAVPSLEGVSIPQIPHTQDITVPHRPVTQELSYPTPPQINTFMGHSGDTLSSSMTESAAPHYGTSYALFSEMDHSCAPTTQSCIDLDMNFSMDMGLGFGINVDSLASNDAGRSGAYDHKFEDMDFENAFTDDDFSFFDRPSHPPMAGYNPNDPFSPSKSSATPSGYSGFNLSAISTSNVQATRSSGRTYAHESHWTTPTAHHDDPTPFPVDQKDLHPPELVSSSTSTPEGHSLPATPNIHLIPNLGHSRHGPGNCDVATFEPIPFASVHSAADGKYVMGKFSFSDKDKTSDNAGLEHNSAFPDPLLPSCSVSWKSWYNAITDPRVGVIRKLIGVKRKLSHALDNSPYSSWKVEQDEWTGVAPSASGENEEMEASDEYDDDGSDAMFVSRPITPLPASLPLGPSLLHTHFQHSQLLPLSRPLRPVGAAVDSTNMGTAPLVLSVLTPVSPAAAMGAACEKSKSLESAANIIATEVVENALWADIWKLCAGRPRQHTEVWFADVISISCLLGYVSGLEGPLDMRQWFGLDESQTQLQKLETPMIEVGKNDAIVQVLPTALRFWTKLGLGPKGGRKNAVGFVLFEESVQEGRARIDGWTNDLSNVYQQNQFGHLQFNKKPPSTDMNLQPFRFDISFRKTLLTFMTALSQYNHDVANFVFIVVIPVQTINFSSAVFRQILAAVKNARKKFADGRALFQFVPESYVLGGNDYGLEYQSHMEKLCTSLYNRIRPPVVRCASRQLFEGAVVCKYMEEPSFTLARTQGYKISFSRAPRAVLDVLDRHTLLQVGYGLSACGRWITAACVTERGDAHDLAVWLAQTPGEEGEGSVSDEMHIVLRVWGFVSHFARRASVDWRVVVCKLGGMSRHELNVWTEHLANEYNSRTGHITLLSVELDASLHVLTRTAAAPAYKSGSPTASTKPHLPQSTFVDVSSATYVLYPGVLRPVCTPPSLCELALGVSFIPDDASPSSFTPAHTVATSTIPAVQGNHNVPTNATINTPTSAVHGNTPSTGQEAPWGDETQDMRSYPERGFAHGVAYLPRATAVLVRETAGAVGMLFVHLLHVLDDGEELEGLEEDGRGSAGMRRGQELLGEITRNFHALSVLSKERWGLDANPILPFHLAAVEVMLGALDKEGDHGDG